MKDTIFVNCQKTSSGISHGRRRTTRLEAMACLKKTYMLNDHILHLRLSSCRNVFCNGKISRLPCAKPNIVGTVSLK